MYRILRALRGAKDGEVIEKGSIHDLAYLEPAAIERLLKQGNIATIASPPLKELPGWATRVRKLEAEGVVTAEQFLEKEDTELARIMRRTVEEIDILKGDVRAALIVTRRK